MSLFVFLLVWMISEWGHFALSKLSQTNDQVPSSVVFNAIVMKIVFRDQLQHSNYRRVCECMCEWGFSQKICNSDAARWHLTEICLVFSFNWPHGKWSRHFSPAGSLLFFIFYFLSKVSFFFPSSYQHQTKWIFPFFKQILHPTKNGEDYKIFWPRTTNQSSFHHFPIFVHRWVTFDFILAINRKVWKVWNFVKENSTSRMAVSQLCSYLEPLLWAFWLKWAWLEFSLFFLIFKKLKLNHLEHLEAF